MWGREECQALNNEQHGKRGQTRDNKTGHQCHQVPLESSSYSISTTDLWISCSLFRIENGDWANFPQVFLTINQQREAHLHTLSWWLSAIFQNSVVISSVSQGGAVLDAPTFHNLLKCTRGNGRVPLGLSGCFQTWWLLVDEFHQSGIQSSKDVSS